MPKPCGGHTGGRVKQDVSPPVQLSCPCGTGVFAFSSNLDSEFKGCAGQDLKNPHEFYGSCSGGSSSGSTTSVWFCVEVHGGVLTAGKSFWDWQSAQSLWCGKTHASRQACFHGNLTAAWNFHGEDGLSHPHTHKMALPLTSFLGTPVPSSCSTVPALPHLQSKCSAGDSGLIGTGLELDRAPNQQF